MNMVGRCTHEHGGEVRGLVCRGTGRSPRLVSMKGDGYCSQQTLAVCTRPPASCANALVRQTLPPPHPPLHYASLRLPPCPVLTTPAP